MSQITYTIERDGEELNIEVEYSLAPFYPGCTYGPPEDCYPDEGGEIEELTAYWGGGEIKLSAAEIQRLEAHIYDNHDHWG